MRNPLAFNEIQRCAAYKRMHAQGISAGYELKKGKEKDEMKAQTGQIRKNSARPINS